jgi:hypothetical protein
VKLTNSKKQQQQQQQQRPSNFLYRCWLLLPLL